jgi:bacteriorhodopsin
MNFLKLVYLVALVSTTAVCAHTIKTNPESEYYVHAVAGLTISFLGLTCMSASMLFKYLELKHSPKRKKLYYVVSIPLLALSAYAFKYQPEYYIHSVVGLSLSLATIVCLLARSMMTPVIKNKRTAKCD